MKKILALLALPLFSCSILCAQDYFDDVYYDGRAQEANKRIEQQQLETDAYNGWGGYYASAIDTIGSGMAQSADFPYTARIQKFYNPTIVVDNSETLGELIDALEGNVEIVYTGSSLPNTWIYSPGLYTPYQWYNPWGGWYSMPYGAWSAGWYNPWVADMWAWGWGSGWGWGWTSPGCWYPHYHHHHHDLWAGGYGGTYHNRPATGVRPGWSRNARPGDMHAGMSARPGTNVGRPGASRYHGSVSRPDASGRHGNVSRPGTSSRPGTISGARPGSNLRPGNNPGVISGAGGAATSSRPAHHSSGAIGGRPGINTGVATVPSTVGGGVTRPSTSSTPSTTARPGSSSSRGSSMGRGTSRGTSGSGSGSLYTGRGPSSLGGGTSHSSGSYSSPSSSGMSSGSSYGGSSRGSQSGGSRGGGSHGGGSRGTRR